MVFGTESIPSGLEDNGKDKGVNTQYNQWLNE
jgi:hypothetical protein